MHNFLRLAQSIPKNINLVGGGRERIRIKLNEHFSTDRGSDLKQIINRSDTEVKITHMIRCEQIINRSDADH